MLELDFIADEDLVLLSRIYTHPYYNLLVKRFLKYGISIINGVLSGMSVIQKSAEDYLEAILHLSKNCFYKYSSQV